jgi:hypothetical protein
MRWRGERAGALRRPWLRGRRGDDASSATQPRQSTVMLLSRPDRQQDASCAAHRILDWRASKDDISAGRGRSLARLWASAEPDCCYQRNTSSRGTDKAIGSNSLGDSGSACSARHFRSSYTKGKRSPDRHLTVGLAVADRH